MTGDAVDLAYETSAGERRTLPIRLGVLGNFAGDTELSEPSERCFVPVTTPDLASAFAAIRPELHLTIEDERGDLLPVRLTFAGLDDFAPAAIARRFGSTGRAAPPEPDAGGSLLDRILVGEEQATSASRQADQVLRDERFQRLHAAWLGLAHLASCCGERVTLAVLAARKAELVRDLERAPDLEHALLYRRLYDDPYRKPDGVPFAAVVCDHACSTHPDDIGLLRYVATVAAEAQTPVLASAAPSLLDLDWNDFAPLGDKRGLTDFLGGPQHTSWRSLRAEDELRFVTLALPRWRTPSPQGGHTPWIGAAYLLGGQLAAAYARHGWPAALGEPELASDVEVECEVSDAARRSLFDGGLALLERTPSGALVSAAPSVHRPLVYEDPQATALARQLALLPYVAASSRIHQHMLCIARDHPRSPHLAEALTAWLADHAADAAIARNDPRHPIVLEDRVEVTQDGFAHVRMRPAYQLPPASGTPRISLPLPLFG